MNLMNGYWWKYRNGNGNGFIDPDDAPDADFLHRLDYSDDDRRVEDSGTYVTQMWTQKDKKLNPDGVKFSAGIAVAPLITAETINGLKTVELQGTLSSRRQVVANTIDDAYQFSYTDYTIFAVIKTNMLNTEISYIMTDYGNIAFKLMYFKIGDGSSLKLFSYMRDADGDELNAESSGVLVNDTPTLVVARMNGSGKRNDVWIGGLGNSGTDANANYDGVTTFEGEVDATAIPTMGALANGAHSNPFDGYVGEIFMTKTALSNEDVNSYAGFLAEKWDVTWNAI